MAKPAKAPKNPIGKKKPVVQVPTEPKKAKSRGKAKKPSSPTATEEGKRGAAPAALAETPARDGAPRPFKDTGVLIKPQKTPRSAAVIFAVCEKQLVTHLKAVCLWPQKSRNESWCVGDYSFYILEFDPAPDTRVYVQFWSEPDEDGAIFEVCSGAWNPPTDKYVDAEKQELLRDHGFEIGGNASNFRKIVAIESPEDLRAIAREAVAIVCKVLDYDGTRELRYSLNLQTNMATRSVLAEVSPYTLEKMLREWGFPADLKRDEGKPPWIESRTDHGPFVVRFTDQTKEGSGRYHVLKVRTFRKSGPDVAQALKVANFCNQRVLAVKGTVNEDGDMMFESDVLLHAGVTMDHLQARFELWRQMIGELAESAER